MANLVETVTIVHIPAELRCNILRMTPVRPTTGNNPTIFVGIVNELYSDEEWDEHSMRLRRLFNITDDKCCCNVKYASSRDLATSLFDLDISNSLAQQTKRATDVINNSKTDMIRIVGLGQGSSSIVMEAMEILIEDWNTNSVAEKKVQFVAMGESEDYHYLNFCKGLCLTGKIGSLDYYNTMDFTPFGRFDQYKRADRSVQCQQLAERTRKAMMEMPGPRLQELMLTELLSYGMRRSAENQREQSIGSKSSNNAQSKVSQMQLD